MASSRRCFATGTSTVGIVMITVSSFSLYRTCWTSGTGWLHLSSVLCSPRTSPRLGRSPLVALPAVGSALVLPAVGYALLPAVGCALLGSFHPFPLLDDGRCSAGASSFSTSLSLTLRGQLFDVLLAVLVPVLLYSVLLATGSFAVALSPILSRDTLWYFPVSWMPRLHLHHNYSALRPS